MRDGIEAFFLIVLTAIFTLVFFVWYKNSHRMIAVSPEAELKGWLGALMTCGIVAFGLSAILIYVVEGIVIWMFEHWYIFAAIAGVIYWLYTKSTPVTEEQAAAMCNSLRQHPERFEEVAKNSFLDYHSISIVQNDNADYVFDIMLHLYDADNKGKLSDMLIYLVRIDFDHSRGVSYYQYLTAKKDFNSDFKPLEFPPLKFTQNQKPVMDKLYQIPADNPLYQSSRRIYTQLTGQKFISK